jgi:hypothetical protein
VQLLEPPSDLLVFLGESSLTLEFHFLANYMPVVSNVVNLGVWHPVVVYMKLVVLHLLYT